MDPDSLLDKGRTKVATWLRYSNALALFHRWRAEEAAARDSAAIEAAARGG